MYRKVEIGSLSVFHYYLSNTALIDLEHILQKWHNAWLVSTQGHFGVSYCQRSIPIAISMENNFQKWYLTVPHTLAVRFYNSVTTSYVYGVFKTIS
jgi:hypothetical protein